MVKSQALFDVLYIGESLEKRLYDFTSSEVNTMSYLACLLSLFSGTPITYWEYSFIKNNVGSPYSKDIDDAITALSNSSMLFKDEHGFMKVTEFGKKQLVSLKNFTSYKDRIKYIDGACDSLLLIPYGNLQNSVLNEPNLFAARKHEGRRILIDEQSPTYKILYEQFGMLKHVLGRSDMSLVVPAHIWLEYLSQFAGNFE